MGRAGIELKIAEKVYEAEKRNAAMLGYEKWEIPLMGFGAFCGVYSLAGEPEKAAVLTRFRALRVGGEGSCVFNNLTMGDGRE